MEQRDGGKKKRRGWVSTPAAFEMYIPHQDFSANKLDDIGSNRRLGT